MSARPTPARRCALRLAVHAGRILPPRYADWARAIEAEVAAISNDLEALRWAIGGVVAAYRKRMTDMELDASRVSPWILGLETVICFVPVTWLGLVVMHALTVGAMAPAAALGYLSVAAIGPIGLVTGIRLASSRTRQLGPAAKIGTALAACWTLLAFVADVLDTAASFTHWWREITLIALLPAAGAAHLILIASRRSIRPQPHRDGTLA